MKKILVATDGSDHAAHAVALAADLAEKYDAQLLIAHVADDRPLMPEVRHFAEVEFADRLRRAGGQRTAEALAGYGSTDVGDYLRDQQYDYAAVKQAIGEDVLEKARKAVKNLKAADIETLLLSGDPAEEIIKAAETNGANLIVIGSRGLSDLKGLWLGSVSHKVANRSPINVVTVR